MRGRSQKKKPGTEKVLVGTRLMQSPPLHMRICKTAHHRLARIVTNPFASDNHKPVSVESLFGKQRQRDGQLEKYISVSNGLTTNPRPKIDHTMRPHCSRVPTRTFSVPGWRSGLCPSLSNDLQLPLCYEAGPDGSSLGR